jgi:hypothetical protein
MRAKHPDRAALGGRDLLKLPGDVPVAVAVAVIRLPGVSYPCVRVTHSHFTVQRSPDRFAG